MTNRYPGRLDLPKTTAPTPLPPRASFVSLSGGRPPPAVTPLDEADKPLDSLLDTHQWLTNRQRTRPSDALARAITIPD